MQLQMTSGSHFFALSRCVSGSRGGCQAQQHCGPFRGGRIVSSWRLVLVSLLVATLGLGDRALADNADAGPSDGGVLADGGGPADGGVPGEAAVAAVAKPPASLEFDLFGEAPKKPTAPGLDLSTKTMPTDPLAFARLVKKRRLMLQLHTGIGFATLAVFAATIVIGQLSYLDKYGGGDDSGRYRTPHLGLAATTTALFATDALLALFAPTPYRKPFKADVALLHKVMMGLATAGMAAEIALGFATASKGGELVQRELALGHVVNGYVTFACMAAGYLAYVF